MGSNIIRAGDRVRYVGYSTSAAKDEEGTVCHYTTHGRPFNFADADSYDNVPVQFDTWSRVFTAWAFNLKVIGLGEPKWEV